LTDVNSLFIYLSLNKNFKELQMFRVTVVGETPTELKQKLVDLAESFSTGKKSIVTKEEFEAAEEIEEEAEEVSSPFAAKTSDELLETDSEGLMWDVRVHSSSKNKTAKGAWKLKKGYDKDALAAVKEEQLGVAAPVVTPAAPMVDAPVVTPTAAQPAAVPSINPPMPSMQTGGHTLSTFTANFPLVIASLITEKKITQEWVNELKGHFGVAEIWMINDEQKSQVFDLLVQHGLVVRVG
jgi:hypothetical protein